MRIRVVRRDGNPPRLYRAIVRAAIACAIYVAYESAADVSAIEPLYAIVTFTVVAGLLAVCYLVNTRTQQLPHDLATATYVVSASRPPVSITETFWRGKRSHTTQFKVRPGSDDQQQDWTIRLRELRQDLIPPLVNRQMSNLMRRLRKVRGSSSAASMIGRSSVSSPAMIAPHSLRPTAIVSSSMRCQTRLQPTKPSLRPVFSVFYSPVPA